MMTEEQITALINNNSVLAPQKDILEVQNAIEVYNMLHNFKPFRLKSLLEAHQILMNGLIPNAGKFINGNVGIVKGSKILPKESVLALKLNRRLSATAFTIPC